MGANKELFNQERILAMNSEDSIINKHYDSIYYEWYSHPDNINRRVEREVGTRKDRTREDSAEYRTEAED